MKETPKSPSAKEPSPMEKMTELTRRLIAVPKKELDKLKKDRKGDRG